MAELSPADVEAFTNQRLSQSNPEVQRLLDVALQVARREAGWHVSPVREADKCVLDAPRGNILALPTLRLVELIEVAEDDVPMDVHRLRISGGRPPGALGGAVTLRRKHRYYGCWPALSITVTMSHGYTEDEAADWRQAVLMLVDAMSTVPVMAGSERSGADLLSKQVDDVSLGWRAIGLNQASAMSASAVYAVQSLLDGYKLPSECLV